MNQTLKIFRSYLTCSLFRVQTAWNFHPKSTYKSLLTSCSTMYLIFPTTVLPWGLPIFTKLEFRNISSKVSSSELPGALKHVLVNEDVGSMGLLWNKDEETCDVLNKARQTAMLDLKKARQQSACHVDLPVVWRPNTRKCDVRVTNWLTGPLTGNLRNENEWHQCFQSWVTEVSSSNECCNLRNVAAKCYENRYWRHIRDVISSPGRGKHCLVSTVDTVRSVHHSCSVCVWRIRTFSWYSFRPF